jgi:hypothetical protein
MNDKLFTFRKTCRMTCAWVSTGDAKTPLACVWVEAETSRTASAAQTASNDGSGEGASMRLEELQLDAVPIPATNGVLVRGTWQKHMITKIARVLRTKGFIYRFERVTKGED